MINLTFLGGADEVGASSLLVEMGGKRLLIDAGIRISPRSNRGIAGDQLPDLHPISAVGGIDYLLVTHAHTDHTGALPLVLEQYPHVPLLATRPTIALTTILQRDAQRIMRTRQDEEGELPIFDEVASDRLIQAFQPVEFNQPIHLGDSLQVTYHVSGHIAGAASLVLEGEDGILVISGDVSISPQRTVVSAQIPKVKADVLVLESTYGGKLHANRAAEERRLIETVKAVTDAGGKVLIPAFALGRAQEVLQILLAFRDQLDVPVYVDGMVRAVCQGYHTFADLLPAQTVKMAGDDHLFFRKNIKKVESNNHRIELMQNGTPAVIVASSGMITGGASAAWAKALAGNPQNAILLTGYQDEEAPGKALQRLAKGEEGSIKIDGQPVDVQCVVDTYSLSAHADETELVNMAEAVDAENVLLVHGDAGARHSLASALRQRDRRVLLPKIGQTIPFSPPPRPWAVGRIKGGHETQTLDALVLWERLKDQAGSFYSSKELAQMWWGDVNRSKEVFSVLSDGVYFAPDWRLKDTFKVRSAEQVETTLRARKIMQSHPDLVGQLVVLRDSNNRVRVGVVASADIDSFEAEVANAKGRNYPASALLWVLGKWQGYEQGEGLKSQITAMTRAAKTMQDTIIPFTKRQQLAAAGQPVNPTKLVSEPSQIALLAVVLALGEDGAVRVEDGLIPKRARQDEPMEQNQAREAVFALFPPEARLRKVGMEVHRKRITLTFDFPERAAALFAELLDEAEEQTGWEVQVKPGVNQQALPSALLELMPETGRITKGPSFYMDKQEMVVELAGVTDIQALSKAFFDVTGFRIKTSQATGGAAAQPIATTPSNTKRLEINAAYEVIREALEPYGLYKSGLKQDGIVLTFISPQIGERQSTLIKQLAERIGYPLSIHPHPNQQQILQVATTLIRQAGWGIRKGPGIHTDKGEVAVTLQTAPTPDQVERVAVQFESETGYKLVVL